MDDYKKRCNATIHQSDQIDGILNKHNDIILDAIETYIENGSNFQLYSIVGIFCNIDKY